MSDCADSDIWETCWTLSDTAKQKKKNKKRKRYKVDTASNNEGNSQKKNKECKAVMKLKKDKKNKRKKKKMPALEDGFIFTQRSITPIAEYRCPEQIPVREPKASNSDNPELPQPHKVTEDSLPKKYPRTKKKVAFDLSPGCIPVKRPKLSIPKSHSWESSLSYSDGVKNDANLLTDQTQAKPQDNDSQCTDDTNSQDLFITQKTFISSAEASPGETNEEGSITQQEEESHTPHASHKDTNTHGQFSQKPRNTNKMSQGSQDVQALHALQQDRCKVNPPSQPQKRRLITDGTNSTKLIPKRENLYLAMPINKQLDLTKPPVDVYRSSQKTQWPLHKHSQDLRVSTASAATQTENFFTTQLTSYFSFQLQSRVTLSTEELKPLDLSLPHRMKAESSRCFPDSFKIFNFGCNSDDKNDRPCDHQRPSSSPIEIKDEVEDAGEDPSYCSGLRNVPQSSFSVTQQKAETTPSPQSESEPKFSDTTSSEDNEHTWRSSKVDIRQVKAIQMKLNESFFFKTKGERQSPRPESPLMKLSQGREKTNRKMHSGYVV